MIDLLKFLPAEPKDHEVVEFDSKTDQAVERLRRAAHDFPENSEVAGVEARLWQRLGESDKAKFALKKAIRAKPRNSSAFLQLSNIHRQAKSPTETLGTLKDGLEKFPSDKNLHLRVALHLVEISDQPSTEIEGHFRASFAAGDHNFDGRFFYAEYLFWAGKLDDSMSLFAEIDQRATESFRKTAPSSEDLLTSKLGRCHGIVEGVHPRFFFVRYGGYPRSIFAHWRALTGVDYDTLRTDQQVSFKFRFNRKGPVAVDVKQE